MQKVTNKLLLREVLRSKDDERMTDELISLFQQMVHQYVNLPKYANYPFKEDMEAYSMMMLCVHWWRFRPLISENAYAYYVSCIHSHIIQYICREKKQTEIKADISNYRCPWNDNEQ